MSDLTAAADAIDHLIDAVTAADPRLTGEPWRAVDAEVRAGNGNGLSHVIATCEIDGDPDQAAKPLAALIAALASPDRARALAQLLRAIPPFSDDIRDPWDTLTEIMSAGAALARLYTGSSDARQD